MTRSRVRYLAGPAGVLLAVAACGGGDDGSDPTTSSGGGYGAPGGEYGDDADDGSTGDDADADDGSTGDDATAAIVTTQTVDDIGTVLADSDGLALYTNEAEADGSIKCVDTCEAFWPPLEGSEDALPTVEGLSGELGVTERPDGTSQVTLDGQPLYTFAEDTGPGSVTGDGFEDDFQGEHFVWHVVTVE